MSTTKFKVNGVDLSTVFAAYTSGTKATTTGYKVAGNDLSNIFAPYVSGTKASTTGIKVAGNDLSNIFAPLSISKTWSALGTAALTGTGAVCNVIYIDSSTGFIYIGGIFTSVGGVTAKNIARWNGTTWSALASGLSDAVYDILIVNGILYTCGFFTDDGLGTTFLTKFAYYTPGANYSNGSWTRIDIGFPNSSTCYCLETDPLGNIYIGGDYARQYNTGVNGDWRSIAYWNGTAMLRLPDSAGPQRGGFGPNFSSCFDMKRNPVNGHMYFGGNFTGFYPRNLTATTCNYLCGYDGTFFYTMGSGPGTNGAVYSVEVDPSGAVYFGGTFTTVGTLSVNNIVKWTPSTGNNGSFSALGIGLNGKVDTLNYFNGILYAGGSFTQLGDNTTTVNYIAQYDGTSWSVISTSLNNIVQAITVGPSGTIFAGGSFTSPYVGLAKYS